MISRYSIWAVLLVVLTSCGVAVTPAKLSDVKIDVKIHGSYIGINPLAAARGASFEESKVQFSVNNKGLTVWQTISENGIPLVFQVRYPSEWVFHLKGWGVDECLALRQHQNSNLAQLIFCFSTHAKIKKPYDATMLLGEGMPAVLGVFVRKETGWDVLQKIHESIYEPREVGAARSYLIPIDLDRSQNIMKLGSGYNTEKIGVLKDATHNLWTGTEQEIADRQILVSMGLNDPDPTVQYEAARTLIFGGRVGIKLVTDLLKRYKYLREKILKETIYAAYILLQDAYEFNKTVTVLENAFGVSDSATIHEITGGSVAPEYFEAMKRMSWTRPQRRWTLQHQIILRNSIKRVINDRRYVHKGIREIGLKALAETPLPD